MKQKIYTKYVTFKSGNYTDFDISSESFTCIISVIPIVSANPDDINKGFVGCASTDNIQISYVSNTKIRIYHERNDTSSNDAYVRLLITGF